MPDRADIYKNAQKIIAQMRQIPGISDLRVQQPPDYPTLKVAVEASRRTGRDNVRGRGRPAVQS